MARGTGTSHQFIHRLLSAFTVADGRTTAGTTSAAIMVAVAMAASRADIAAAVVDMADTDRAVRPKSAVM